MRVKKKKSSHPGTGDIPVTIHFTAGLSKLRYATRKASRNVYIMFYLLARMVMTHCGAQCRTLSLTEQLARLKILMTADGSLEAERDIESSGW